MKLHLILIINYFSLFYGYFFYFFLHKSTVLKYISKYQLLLRTKLKYIFYVSSAIASQVRAKVLTTELMTFLTFQLFPAFPWSGRSLSHSQDCCTNIYLEKVWENLNICICFQLILLDIDTRRYVGIVYTII